MTCLTDRHRVCSYVGMADEACVVRPARNRERTQTENRSNEQPQNQPRTIILTMSWFQISNSAYMIFPANQRPCQLFLWCCSDWLSTPPFTKLLLSYRPWITRQVLNRIFLRSKNWTESENNTSALCNFFHHHVPRDISGVWTLSPLMKFTYTNSQQPHTQGLLKCAVYGLKYYGWATREKLYHSYPTTDTSLVPSHYETEPSASRI